MDDLSKGYLKEQNLGFKQSPGFAALARTGIEVDGDLRRAVVEMMVNQLPAQFVASCVRTRDFTEWGGGLKSELVGRLELSVVAGLKIGGQELHKDAALMRAVNAAGKAVFIEPLQVVEAHNSKTILLMEGLEKHSTLLEVVYTRAIDDRVVNRVLERVFKGLSQIRSLEPSSMISERISVTPDPYSDRLGTIFPKVLSDHDCKKRNGYLDSAGMLDGVKCPPVASLVHEVCDWLKTNTRTIELALVHGDPHLRNILVRKRGKGYGFRFIDPNSAVGITDPLYDIGKLLHWAEELGWSQVDERVCNVKSISHVEGGMWSLSAWITPRSQIAEQRRRHLEAEVLHRAKPLLSGPGALSRLHLSVASAHFGLFNLFVREGKYDMANFSLYYVLRALLRWKASIQ